MRGSEFSGAVELWRGKGHRERPMRAYVTGRAVQAPPEEGPGYEVEDFCSTWPSGQPAELTPAELERALEQIMQHT